MTARARAAGIGPERPVAPFSGPRRQKYGAVPTVVDGRRFASKREAERYMALSVMLRAGEITDLECQPRFPLVVHEQDCGAYVGDFAYVVAATGERVVEDVKSPPTRKLPVYRMKRRLVWVLYGLTIREV